MEKFPREVLQGIRDDATIMADVVKNDHWKRAYRELADATDRLDAMEARIIEPEAADCSS